MINDSVLETYIYFFRVSPLLATTVSLQILRPEGSSRIIQVLDIYSARRTEGEIPEVVGPWLQGEVSLRWRFTSQLTSCTEENRFLRSAWPKDDDEVNTASIRRQRISEPDGYRSYLVLVNFSAASLQRQQAYIRSVQASKQESS